jgi:hypothetical protein
VTVIGFLLGRSIIILGLVSGIFIAGFLASLRSRSAWHKSFVTVPTLILCSAGGRQIHWKFLIFLCARLPVLDIIIIIITFTRERHEGFRHASLIPRVGDCRKPAWPFSRV